MEKTGLMTLSTACITPETAGMIAKAAKNDDNDMDIISFEKGVYGWFVYVMDNMNNLPEDLRDCMAYAKENECDWICFDRDAEFNEADGLKKYEVW